MSSIWGNKIKVSLFGESHGPAIGVVIDGLPAGIELDMEHISAHMKRRAPGNHPWTTPRKEKDRPEIVSGLYNGKTCGTPLAALIYNTDTRSSDYSKFNVTPRPGHADLTGGLRYKGANDPRGSGHFSGRITASLTFAGAICIQILQSRGVSISARILEIAGIRDGDHPDPLGPFNIPDSTFPVLDIARGDLMKAAIANALEENDSVGGIVEAVACGYPAGIGSPFFDKVESRLASIMMALPATKGVEFGRGFDVARTTGSQNNDVITIDDSGRFSRRSNHAGGTEGGISTGMPILLRVAFKPASSIARPQETVNLETQKTTTLEARGRHDPCIVPRALVVVESSMALALLDLLE